MDHLIPLTAVETEMEVSHPEGLTDHHKQVIKDAAEQHVRTLHEHGLHVTVSHTHHHGHD